MVPLDIARLVRVLGMLGSAFAGERAAAAAKASEMIRSANLTWDDLLSPTSNRSFPAPPIHFRHVQFALDHAEQLNSWELKFVRDLAGFQTLSEKQARKLMLILTKVNCALRARRP